MTPEYRAALAFAYFSHYVTSATMTPDAAKRADYDARRREYWARHVWSLAATQRRGRPLGRGE